LICKFKRAREIIQKKYFIFFYKEYCKNFALPLSGSYFLTYLNKDHGANVLLGSAFGPEIVSVIAITKNLYEAIHKFINNFIIKIYPMYLHHIKTKKIKNIIFKKIFYFGNLLYFAIFCLLIFFKDVYFSVMDLKNTKMYSIIYIIVSINFLIKFLPSYLTHVINVSINTKSILISNFFITFFVTIFSFIGIYYQNILVCLIGYIVGFVSVTPHLFKSCPPDFKFNDIKYFFILQIFIIITLSYYVLYIY
jgi:O-antigen/teichoic acid export membrane protein